MDLFDYMRENMLEKEAPLASRLRTIVDKVLKWGLGAGANSTSSRTNKGPCSQKQRIRSSSRRVSLSIVARFFGLSFVRVSPVLATKITKKNSHTTIFYSYITKKNSFHPFSSGFHR